MARVAINHEDDPTQVQDPTQSVGGGYTGGDLGGGGGAPAANPAPRRSRFQDISRLLYANQGQGQKLAEQAVDAVGRKAQTAQNQLGAATKAYQTQAEAQIPQTPAPYTAPPTVGGVSTPIQPRVPGIQTPTTAQIQSRPTTTLNVPADNTTLAQQQALANATYSGPNSLNQAAGVDQAGLQQSFTNAERAAGLLNSPSGVSTLLGRSGGAGLLDDLLASREGGATLAAGRKRFSGLADMLNNAVSDTSTSDKARAAVDTARAEGQKYLDDAAAATNDRIASDTKAANDAEAQRQADDALFEQFAEAYPGLLMTNQGIPGMPNGFSSKEELRRWFDNNKDAVRQRLAR